MMKLRYGALSGLLGDEGGALMSGISALIKEAPSTTWEHSKKAQAVN